MFLLSLTFRLLLAYLCKGTEDLHLDGARIHKIFPNFRETILDPPFTRGIFHTPRPLFFEFGTPILEVRRTSVFPSLARTKLLLPSFAP